MLSSAQKSRQLCEQCCDDVESSSVGLSYSSQESEQSVVFFTHKSHSMRAYRFFYLFSTVRNELTSTIETNSICKDYQSLRNYKKSTIFYKLGVRTSWSSPSSSFTRTPLRSYSSRSNPWSSTFRTPEQSQSFRWYRCFRKRTIVYNSRRI